MNELCVNICNCEILGEEVSSHPKSNRFTRFSLSSREFELHQINAFGYKSGGEQSVHTSFMLVKNITPNEIDDVKKEVGFICEILTFITGSKVMPFGYSYPDGKTYSGYSVKGNMKSFRPLIEVANSKGVRGFVEKVWCRYKECRAARQLHVVIDYLDRAEESIQPIEVQLILIFVVFENLKHTYAIEKKIPYHKGGFRRLSDPPKASLSKEHKYTFRELLGMMFEEVGMSPDLSGIVDIRNEIIHSGLSSTPSSHDWELYQNCQDVIREYIMTLLRYRGEYLIYSMASRVVAVI